MNNNLYNFLIIAILIIAFLLTLQKNKNEHIDTIPDNLTVKNITTSDSINVGTNLGKLKLGTGSISYGNGDGYGLKLGKEGSPTLTVYDNNWITAKGTIDAQEISAHTLTATGPIGGWDVNAKNNINAGGIVTAKKFVSTDGSSGSPLSNEAIQSIASVYNKDNLTATNINATGGLNSTGTTHFTGYGTDSWFPFTDGHNYIRGPTHLDGPIVSNINVTGSIDAKGGFKTPIDLTEVNATGGKNPDSPGRVGLWADWKGSKVRCPDKYYVAGFDQRGDTGMDTYPICRKLPGA